jgi:hypothetical protein
MWGFGRKKQTEPKVLDVTKAEFVQKAIDAGHTPEDADSLAEQSKNCFGDGHVRVGDELLQVVAFKPSSSTT